MKQKEVFNKIGGIIQELNDQYEYLKTVTEDLNDLELELFVSNAHFLTDHIEILCKLNLQNAKLNKQPAEKPFSFRPVIERPPVEKTETPHEHKYFEPVVQQMKLDNEAPAEQFVRPPFKPVDLPVNNVLPIDKIEDKEDKPAPLIYLDPEEPPVSYPLIYEDPEIIRHELILDESQNWEDDEHVSFEDDLVQDEKKDLTEIPRIIETVNSFDSAKEAEPMYQKPQAETPVVATEDQVLTINQKMMSQLGDKTLARTEQLGVKPISDIKLAITLNDKLLYVKDLFNGYNLAYSEAIEILNRFNTFEEAMRFLKTNYVTKNNWDSKPATTEKFYALLMRRYA